MPLFDYRCVKCGERFTELVRSFEETPVCPKCGGKGERVWSGCMHSATGKLPKHCSGKCSECPGCH